MAAYDSTGTHDDNQKGSNRSTSCQFAWSDADKYLVCMRKFLDCNTDRVLGAQKDSSRLSPTRALALRLLSKRADAESQDIVAALKPFLLPSIKASGPTSNATDIPERLEATRTAIMKLRQQIEPDAAFAQVESIVAVRKDLLSASLNQIASTIAPRATFQIDRRQENFNKTISSPPAADLKCDQHLRGCPSDFDADYARDHPYIPRGCDSNCTIRKCDSGDISRFLNRGREICIDTIDLPCSARKLDCERLKEQERLTYEATKAAAKADWILKKFDCERLKEIEKTGCNINQAWLRIVGDKELGRVEGNAVISSADAMAEFRSLRISPSLDEISLSTFVAGSALVEASFIYTPLNAGHVVCIAQWGGNIRASVSLPPKEFTLRAVLDQQGSNAGGVMVYRLEEVETGIKMSPAPGVALLSQNPHMALSCPAVGALASAAPLTVAIVLPLLDTIPVKVPAREIRLPLIGDTSESVLGKARPRVRLGVQSVLLVLAE